MNDIVHELDGLAIGMASPSLGRDTVSRAAREVEKLRRESDVLGDAIRRRDERIERLRNQVSRLQDVLTAVKHGAEYPDELGDMIDAAVSSGDGAS